MSKIKRQGFLTIYLSFLIAMMLEILPLPHWAIWFRPLWLCLVTVYWVMALPEYVSVGTAWFVGLLLDVLTGTLLGEHALALTVVCYFVVKLHRQLRVFPPGQQMVVVLLLLLLYQSVIFWIQGLRGHEIESWQYWLATLSSVLLWPWIFILLRDYRRRFSFVVQHSTKVQM